MTKKRYRKGRAAAVIMAAMLVMTGVAGCAGSASQTASQTTEAVSDSSSEESTEADSGESSTTTGQTEVLADSEMDTEFSDKDLDGSYSEPDASAITLSGTGAEISGSGASVSGSTVTITEAGTYIVTGTLEDGQIIVEADDDNDKVQIVLKNADINCETSAAIYVKSADKVFVTLAEGTANTLSGGTEYADIDDNTVDGVIFSKSDLTVNGEGTLEIDANYKHGIVSKDTLAVTGGTIVIDAVSQCLSANDEVKIAGGTFRLTTEGKAVKAENEDDSTLGNIYIAGGTFVIKSEDDAFHAELDLVINGGSINIVDSYEGLEGYRITVNGGSISVTAQDDGVNAAAPDTGDTTAETAGGNPGGGMGGGPGGGGGDMGGGMENDPNAYIKITGGTLTVDAKGDGIDSNGGLIISGGTTYVSGSAENNNSALDYNGTAEISGGTVIAAGSSGMAQGFAESSSQYSISHTFTETKEAESTVTLTDKSGNVLAELAPAKQFNTVIVSAPGLEEGETYTLAAGTESTEITLSSVVTSNLAKGGGMGGAPGGDRGGQMGGGPRGGQKQRTQ